MRRLRDTWKLRPSIRGETHTRFKLHRHSSRPEPGDPRWVGGALEKGDRHGPDRKRSATASPFAVGGHPLCVSMHSFLNERVRRTSIIV